MRTRKLNHSVYQHQYHLVWGTRYRRPFIKQYVKDELLIYIKRIVAKYPTLHLIEVNTDKDHIHLQIEIPPNLTVSTVVQRIKSESSVPLKKRFPFIKEMYLDEGVWSVGYYSSTVGLNEKTIQEYIKYQQREEKPTQFKLPFS